MLRDHSCIVPGLSRTTLATAKSKIHDQSLSMTQTPIGTSGSPTCLLTDEFFQKGTEIPRPRIWPRIAVAWTIEPLRGILGSTEKENTTGCFHECISGKDQMKMKDGMKEERG